MLTVTLINVINLVKIRIVFVLEHDHFNRNKPETTKIKKVNREEGLFGEYMLSFKVFYSNSCNYIFLVWFVKLLFPKNKYTSYEKYNQVFSLFFIWICCKIVSWKIFEKTPIGVGGLGVGEGVINNLTPTVCYRKGGGVLQIGRLWTERVVVKKCALFCGRHKWMTP